MAVAIPEIELADFQKKLRRERMPFEGVLETTYRCNLRCAHCYVNQPVGDAREASRELPKERLLSLVDEIADKGGLYLLLTGGEVLVRPDFPLVYEHALDRGLLVIVFTNGTLITEKIADLFARRPPHEIEITLYGATRETYDKVTQVEGAFDKCMAGIRRLLERGIKPKLKTVALTWNFHEVPQMLEFARSLGVGFRYDSFLNPRVDCGANRNGELQLSAEQAVQLDLFDPARVAELRAFLECHARPLEQHPVEPSPQVYTCGAGQTGFTIDPYGQLQLCQLSRRRSIDLREKSFVTGWDQDLPKLRARTWQTHSVCRTCSLKALCASCPGAAEMETGDIEKLVPQFCEITHRRVFAIMQGETFGHRPDATCCLGDGSGRSAAPEAVAASSCGGCSSAAPPQALLQIERRAARG